MNAEFVDTVPYRSDRGIAMLELVIATPVLLLLTFAAADLGRAYYQYNAMNKAVQAAASYYARNASSGLAAAQQLYKDNVLAAGLTNPAAPTSSEDATNVTLTATYTYQWMTPLPTVMNLISLNSLPASLTFSASSTMRILE